MNLTFVPNQPKDKSEGSYDISDGFIRFAASTGNGSNVSISQRFKFEILSTKMELITKPGVLHVTERLDSLGVGMLISFSCVCIFFGCTT